jgi:1-deoxy-D-xylulose-5-phosphate synthase
MGKNEDIITITPATPYASYLDACFKDFPDRCIDVGMAEQHALGMACGMALKNFKPFVCYQSTFLQRAFDQLIHDASYMDLPLTVLAVRSGFAGLDSATHHGIYDISYLRSIPNLSLYYPSCTEDLKRIMELRATNPKHPMIIFYPYEMVSDHDSSILLSEDIGDLKVQSKGQDGAVLYVGNCIDTAKELEKNLINLGHSYTFISCSQLKPFDKRSLINKIQGFKRLVTLEENVLDSGFGSLIGEIILDEDINISLLRIGLECEFVDAGNKVELVKENGIDALSVIKKMKSKWSLN